MLQTQNQKKLKAIFGVILGLLKNLDFFGFLSNFIVLPRKSAQFYRNFKSRLSIFNPAKARLQTTKKANFYDLCVS